MQREPIQISDAAASDSPTSISRHHGFPQHHHGDHVVRSRSAGSGSQRSDSPRSVGARTNDASDGVDADQLDEKLRGLSLPSRTRGKNQTAGQRIANYENALTPPAPRQALGFKIIKRPGSQNNGIQLEDFPNEILIHVLSHLHPDSHASVALVSKRLYGIVTTPHAWRMAFMRNFPGHTAIEPKPKEGDPGVWAGSTDIIRSETRYFGRLTRLATWRSEYLLRTRLLASLSRGKPGNAAAKPQSGKKLSAVLTYKSRIHWVVTNIDAVFTEGKKPPRAIQGVSDLGTSSMGDPTTGKVGKWGFDDDFAAAQLEEVAPTLVPFGTEDGPAAAPNVMDVSQTYGMLSGEGTPGGRAYFRATGELEGHYLGAEPEAVDIDTDIPKIPAMSEAISSVWLAKTSAVPTVTAAVVGMLTGSTLGVVTAYSLHSDPNLRFAVEYSSMTARWVLSPGVPIVSIKVDDNYSLRRKASGRAWAVALNALGEVFYLTETPTNRAERYRVQDAVQHAWCAGRSAHWHLVESTRRVARLDEDGGDVTRAARNPRTTAHSTKLSKAQLISEAREIEGSLRHHPSYFRKICEGWDMQRKLEVDFANDDGKGAGESIFVIDCGLTDGVAAQVRRFTRSIPTAASQDESMSASAAAGTPSIFGSNSDKTTETQSPRSPPPTPVSAANGTVSHDWQRCSMVLKGPAGKLLASALDCSTYSLQTLSEDSLHAVGQMATAGVAPRPGHMASEIPGRRTRILTIGTSTGYILAWNAREEQREGLIQPLRTIQTESPAITCIAASALYLVHGGSDGLVQAWDPLASSLEPIRTLNARSNSRMPRHLQAIYPTRRGTNRAGAIFLDPDPTMLRGLVSFGSFLRYWAYSSAGPTTGRKRRARDAHGPPTSRRLGAIVQGHIVAETAELRRENEARAGEQRRLSKRFGVDALGDLTEMEAIRYVEMISEEAHQVEEAQRLCDSAADNSLDTESSFGGTTTSGDTGDFEPSIAGPAETTDDEDEYEQQMQQAIRLSLLEGIDDLGQSPRSNSPARITYKTRSHSSRRGDKQSGSSSSSRNMGSPSKGTTEDEDLALALSLSLQDQSEFPPLDTKSVGKGKGVS